MSRSPPSVSEKWTKMPVNRIKLVNNIIETYPNVAEALIVESLQNAIDSTAKKVRIIVDQNLKMFSIEDDGNGMTEEVFRRDYHGIAYSPKDPRRTIGFRGFGNKVYIALGDYVITETRSEAFCGSSKWKLENGFILTDEPRTLKQHGTIAKNFGLDDEILKQLGTTQIRTMVQRHYNAKLRDVLVYINDEDQPVPQKKFKLAHRKKIDITIPEVPDARITGYIGYAKRDLDVDDQKICVAVQGKMIERTLFECSIPKNLLKERVTGEISADFLAKSETTQRHGFRQTRLRAKAWAEMRKRLNIWLSQIERIEQEELTKEERRFLSKITKTIWRILKQLPELDLGVGRIPSQSGKKVDLVATTKEPEDTPINQIDGSEKRSKPPKGTRTHRGLSLGFIDDPDEREIVFQSRIFRINRMHPAYIVAKRDKHTREYHVVKCLLNKLIELTPPQSENLMQAIADLQDKFFRSWAKEYM